MDPYLEAENLWPYFQHELTASLHQLLLPSLADRYRARVGERRYVVEQALFTSLVRQEHHEEFIEIRQRGEGRLITFIDFVNPVNRTTSSGRQAYLTQREEARLAGSNLVEIDLVLQGPPVLDYSGEGLPDWDYAITVTRFHQPDRREIWTSLLAKRLPRFRLPLAKDDRDALVDLHAAFGRAYDQGDFGSQIDYRQDPATTLSVENRRWLDDLLRQRQLR
jgi:hypothetical protein